ncbi:uncharacterized protein MCAP_0864-like isoform X3 [Channa argus]|uniref:uncharacterized protein MCAP_0864-like isoform X3 n=1 Tax=Channa argus TaxID=215402 RepID=UPI003521DC2C
MKNYKFSFSNTHTHTHRMNSREVRSYNKNLFHTISARSTKMVPYVNLTTERTNTGERTEIGSAGELKIYTVVGISFGLLCIIQVVVNVSLHRHGVGFSNRSDNNSTCNFTLIESQSLEKDILLRDIELLNGEKNQLSNENAKLIEENRMLKKNITDQRNQINELQIGFSNRSNNNSTCNFTLIEAESLEKDQLLRDNEKLNREKNQLSNENAKLIEENRMLNKNITDQRNQINELQTESLEKDQLLRDNEKLNREKNQLSNENAKLIEENRMLNKNITDQRNQINELQIGFSNRSDNNSTCNFTLIESQSLEKDILLRDIELLNGEKNQLSNENAKLIEENRMLKKNITDQRNQINELQTESLEKDQLLRDNEKLNREKNQLSNENAKLIEENRMLNKNITDQRNQINELQIGFSKRSAKLIEENMMLKKNITDQRNQISEPQEMNVRCCPPGWMAYKSSCYRLSYGRNTWDYAKQDCLEMGANLVILNSEIEEQVRMFSHGKAVWIGLRAQGTFTWTWTWTWTQTWTRMWRWVDGRSLPYDYYLYPDCDNQPDSCAYVDDHREPRLKTWFKTNCERDFYWICEMEL